MKTSGSNAASYDWSVKKSKHTPQLNQYLSLRLCQACLSLGDSWREIKKEEEEEEETALAKKHTGTLEIQSISRISCFTHLKW